MSASCRAALADQRSMRELLHALPVEGARLGFDTRVMAAIRAEAEPHRCALFFGGMHLAHDTYYAEGATDGGTVDCSVTPGM